MGFKLFHRLRRLGRSKKNLLRVDAQGERRLRRTVINLTEHNATLRQDLIEATNMINSQKTQLAEYDFLLAHALSRAMHMAPTAFQAEKPSPTPSVSSKLPPTSVWIEDIWLCSVSDTKPLRHAQRKWQKGHPNAALEIVSNAISSDPFLSPFEELRCRLFVAAAMHSLGQYEDSNQRLDEALRMISRGCLPQGFQARELTGIGHYIHARNLMALEQLSGAFLVLSRALDTSGYGEKARELQQKAFVDFVCQDAANEHASISSSLQPMLSSRGCPSLSSFESTDYSAW